MPVSLHAEEMLGKDNQDDSVRWNACCSDDRSSMINISSLLSISEADVKLKVLRESKSKLSGQFENDPVGSVQGGGSLASTHVQKKQVFV